MPVSHYSPLHDTNSIRVAHRGQAVGHDQHRDRRRLDERVEGVLDAALRLRVQRGRRLRPSIKRPDPCKAHWAIATRCFWLPLSASARLADLRLRLLRQLVDKGRSVRRPQALLDFLVGGAPSAGRRRRSPRSTARRDGLLADHGDAPVEPGVGPRRDGPAVEEDRAPRWRVEILEQRERADLPEPDGPTSATFAGAARNDTRAGPRFGPRRVRERDVLKTHVAAARRVVAVVACLVGAAGVRRRLPARGARRPCRRPQSVGNVAIHVRERVERV